MATEKESESRKSTSKTKLKNSQNDDTVDKLSTTAAQSIPRGKPKSGRVWKSVRTERHSSIKKVKRFKTSWTEKMEKKKEKDQFKESKNKLREEKANEKRVKMEMFTECLPALLQKDTMLKQKQSRMKRLRTEENKKRKAENQRKSEIVQAIKDPSKIKKMRKKQLRMIETR